MPSKKESLADLLARLRLPESSRTLHAVRGLDPSDADYAYAKYFLDGLDVTGLVARLLDGCVYWSGDAGYQTRWYAKDLSKLQEVLSPAGLVRVTSGLVQTLPTGLVVDGFLLATANFVGKQGAAMFRLTLVSTEGQAYRVEFSSYEAVTEESISKTVSARQIDRAMAGRLVAQVDNYRAGFPVDAAHERDQALRIRVGWTSRKSKLTLLFGDTLVPADEQAPRGGAGRGQGRKPIKSGEPTVSMTARMTKSQREKLERLGGAQWMRERIDEAPEPSLA